MATNNLLNNGAFRNECLDPAINSGLPCDERAENVKTKGMYASRGIRSKLMTIMFLYPSIQTAFLNIEGTESPSGSFQTRLRNADILLNKWVIMTRSGTDSIDEEPLRDPDTVHTDLVGITTEPECMEDSTVSSTDPIRLTVPPNTPMTSLAAFMPILETVVEQLHKAIESIAHGLAVSREELDAIDDIFVALDTAVRNLKYDGSCATSN